MSKKRGKSASAAGQGRWETALMSYAFEEETWKANINFVVENNILDAAHIKALANVVKIPQRKLFSYLHKDDLMEMVNELGNPKNKKPAKVPQFYEITEIIFGLISAGQEIPLPLWAKLIKFGLVNIKSNDMQRKEGESKSKDDRVKGSAKKRPRSKSPGKKGKKTPDPQLPKKDWSTLKKRGEEDDQNKYIDDEPDDGPQHYIFISGFKKAQILPILSELGINVNGVVKIQSESYELLSKMAEEKLASEGLDDDALAVTQSQREIDTKELALFWELLPIVLQRASPTSKLQDLGLHLYTVLNIAYPGDWDDCDNMIGFGTTLFEDMACKVYDTLDWERQYLNYLKNVNLLHVPKFGDQEMSESSPIEPKTVPSATGKRDKTKALLEPQQAVDELVPPITPPAPIETDTRFYQDLMDCVPMESVSVPLILHCMLEQVVATEQDKIPPSEVNAPARADGIHLALAECIADALEGLCLSEEDETVLANDFPQFKRKREAEIEKNRKPEGPVLLHYGDDISVRTHHLATFDGFKPKDAEEEMLNRVPNAKLTSFQTASANVICERTSRLHELYRFITSAVKPNSSDVFSTSEVNRALQLFAFESMDIAEVDENNTVKHPAHRTGNVWDDPYTLAAKRELHQIAQEHNGVLQIGREKGIEEDPEKSSITKTIKIDQTFLAPKRNLNNYTYTESFKSPVLLQMLVEANENYPCMNTYYNKRDNSMLVMFHYPMSDSLQGAQMWSSSLHSDVGFRNYLEYVSGAISDWTKDEEGKYQANVVAMEMEKAKQAADALKTATESQTTPPSTAKRPRSKSPKKGSRRGSASRSSSKVGTSEEQNFSSPFIRAGSLKAESEIQAKLKEEEDRIRKEKESKQSTRRKSTEKVKPIKSAASKSSQDGKRPASGKRPKSGRKSKSRSRSRSSSSERNKPKEPEPEKLKEPALPFTGYDVGNNLINIQGQTSFLYPCDGGTIKTEKICFEQGETSVKVTTYKDGHVFMLHILDPKDMQAQAKLNDLMTPVADVKTKDGAEKGETEIPEKDLILDSERPSSAELLQGKKEEKKCHSFFGSWCASLCDGMLLSLSSNGPDGVCLAATKAKEKLLKLLGEIPPASSPTPLPPGMETPGKKGKKSPRGRSPRGRSPRGKSPKGGKKGKEADKEAEAQRLEELRLQEELERKLLENQEAEELARRQSRMPKFPQLYTSCPDGLSVRFQLDPTSAVTNPDTDEDEYRLMVRQSYPYKTSGRQETEKSRAKPAMDEVSRTILSNGTVIILMNDGSTKILYGNGTVCYNAGSGPIVTEQKLPVTPHSLPSGISQQQQSMIEEQRRAPSAGSKKGSRGRKSSGKTNPEATATATDPSIAGTIGGHGAAAGLEAEAGAKSEADQEKAASWLTTYISGEVTLTTPNGSVTPEEPLLCYTATDPITGEVMFSREDKVIHVDRPDGSSVCDHSDGTRITRYCRNDKVQDGEEQGDSGPSDPVWFVRVECSGYATVTFNMNDNSAVATFGSGSSLVGNVDGTYQLVHWSGGRLDIAADGTVMYTPRPDNDLLLAALSGYEMEEGAATTSNPSVSESIGSYLMRHNAEVCCEAVDQEGNVFQVKTSGDVSVMNPISTGHQSESEIQPDPQPFKSNPMEHHPPRLFVIHNDGTGIELLRHKDVQDYIGDAQLDPTTAVVREPLPEDEKAVGITIMRPHFGNSGDAWIVQKDEADIIPQHLKTRDLTFFPPSENKRSGPEFAKTVGKGLAVGSAPTPLAMPAAPLCPTVLELRQLVQHQPISKDMRHHLATKVMEYGRAACEQELQREAMKVHDPRTAEEQMRASDLLSLVLEFDEEGTPRSPNVPNAQATVTPVPSTGVSHPTVIPDEQFSSHVKIKYEAAVAPPPPPVVPPPRKKLTQADWDQIRRGKEDERKGREALKSKDMPSYFYSHQGKAWLLSQAPDMKSAGMQLAPDPRHDGTEARMYGANQQNGDKSRHASSTSPAQGSRAGQVLDAPSKTRPTNPTPAHACGGGTPTKVRPDNPTPFAAAQPRNMRPSNPTPSHATSGKQNGVAPQQYQPSPIPENPSSAQQRENQMSPSFNQSGEYSVHDSDQSNILPLETEPSDLVLTRSLMYDVTGEPRKERIRLPTSILSDKPGAIPNAKFISVEDPVRRKVKTSSIAGGMVQGYDRVTARGFHLFPPEIVFGVLREGSTYSFTVRLKNTGIDLCRFKVRQPPPGTGMRVQYTPGPVAAGVDTLLEVHIYAIAVGVEGDSGVGTINHQLEIITESEILHLPISAVVLPAHDYDNRSDSMPPGGKAPGVKLCSDKPPSRDGIVRPLKLAAN
ncbi:unnamed protein product [Clavelina lepadiformis]|uniref:Sperm-associated antigen 17 n=1 Tax=Clavelina lepadiformis TaxID=159417 RepID=A0ABP0GTA2_CLALP